MENEVTKTVSLPVETLVAMLKALPEDTLADILWRVLVDYETGPLSSEERKAVEEARSEFEKGESVSWENIR